MLLALLHVQLESPEHEVFDANVPILHHLSVELVLLHPLMESPPPSLKGTDGKDGLILLSDDLSDQPLSLPSDAVHLQEVERRGQPLAPELCRGLPLSHLHVYRDSHLLHPLRKNLIPYSLTAIVVFDAFEVLLPLALVVLLHPLPEISGDIPISVHAHRQLLLPQLHLSAHVEMVPPIQNGGLGCIRALGLQVLLHLLAVAVLPGVHLQNVEGLRELLEVQLALCNTLFVSPRTSLELPSSQSIQAHSHESVPVPIPQFSCRLIIILQGEEALDKVVVLNLFGEVELELRALTGRILREVVALRPCVSEVVVSELLRQSIDYHVLHYTIRFHLVKAGTKAVFLDDAADSIGVVDFFEYSVGNQQVVEHGAHQDLISELNGQIAIQSVLLFLYLEYPPMIPADSLQLAPEEVLAFPPIDSSNNQLHANHPEQSECILLAVLIIDLEGKEYPLFLLGLYLNIAL